MLNLKGYVLINGLSRFHQANQITPCFSTFFMPCTYIKTHETSSRPFIPVTGFKSSAPPCQWWDCTNGLFPPQRAISHFPLEINVYSLGFSHNSALINDGATHPALPCHSLFRNVSETWKANVTASPLMFFFLVRLKTPKRAVFAGSMQLLAGIKLCTGRVLTNHPHYEDRALRERTREVGVFTRHVCLKANSIQVLLSPGQAALLGRQLLCLCGYAFV